MTGALVDGAGWAERLDRWLFAPGSETRLAIVRSGLVVLLGLRIGLGPYRQLAGQAGALWRPRSFLHLWPSMPSLGFMVGVQVIGSMAAVAALVVRRREPVVVAWLSLLVLAGLRTSLGKVLHNDVLLLLASVPFLLGPVSFRWRSGDEGLAWGWPVRAASVVVAGSYFFAGLMKLRHSGLAWATSGNLRWIMLAGEGRSRLPGISRFIGDHAVLASLLAAGMLLLELSFPLVLLRPRLAPIFVAAAAVVHAGGWLTLSLDYWPHLAVVTLVLLAASPRVESEPDWWALRAAANNKAA